MAPAALVTGGARRIGRAICEALAADGWDVAVHYRGSSTEAEALVRQLSSQGVRARAVQADLAGDDAPEALVAAATEALGPLGLLVNNVSVFEDDRFGALDPAAWDRHFAVNLKVPVFLAQAFAAQALPGASIVNVLDQRVLRPNPQFFSYSLTKAALWQATRTMAQALAPRGVRVNGVGPGPTLQSIHQDAADFAREAQGTLLGRAVEPRQIAEAVLYLAAADAVTGQMIAIDSGQHLGWKTPDIIEDA
ncbi:SDR family oxidoreductase [Brevundimonas sp. 2R-24]|uniref:SDR family oxidoreductase n=1 Tax=Peiella sedimenti TaxID=3061083 RepID=A0ABT8SJJ1_9CAUL|nr:SDR family oxidoreductase [Caulobacteraceae bacterium XZ-24]